MADRAHECNWNVALGASLPVVATGLSLLYLLFAIAHPLVLPPDVAKVMSPLAAVTSASFISLATALRRRGQPLDRMAHPVAAAIAGLVLVNVLAHLLIARDALETTNVMMVIVGIGIFFYSYAWAAAVASVAVASWILAILALEPQRFRWLHFGFGIVTAIVISGLGLAIRRARFLEAQRLLRDNAMRHEELRAAHDLLERRVRERTEQLARANEALRLEVEERLRVESSLREEKGRAERAQALRAEFLDIASHELRKPLSTLHLGLGLLKAGEPVPSAALDRLRRQVERLVRLVDDLLDTSRIEHGRLSMDVSDFDLRSLVRDEVEGVRLMAGGRSIGLVLPSDAAPVQGDHGRLGQVLANLLDNALKYSPEGTPIEVRVERKQGEVEVAVADRGPGVAHGERSELFNRFRRGRSAAANRKGLGLGLYLARMIVEMHGGRIGIRGEPGDGSTFWFTLPLRAEAAAHPAQARDAGARGRLMSRQSTAAPPSAPAGPRAEQAGGSEAFERPVLSAQDANPPDAGLGGWRCSGGGEACAGAESAQHWNEDAPAPGAEGGQQSNADPPSPPDDHAHSQADPPSDT